MTQIYADVEILRPSAFYMNKKDIKNFTLPELKEEIKHVSEPPYRATQIFQWLYKKGVEDFDAMSNLSEPLRNKLKERYFIGKIELIRHVKSNDETEKLVFKFSDGNCIETVMIPSNKRKTACLSTQVGCKYACSFCASGLNGFKRNLDTSEILNQALFLQHKLKHNLTNFVFMGMGEPLDNYDNVARAILVMNDKDSMGIAARRMTVSTSGVIPGIEKFKNLGLQVNLSISLHAADNKLRDMFMSVNKKYPLEKLVKTCEDFIQAGGRMLTLEYILIRGVNDSFEDADKLAAIARRLKAKVNLIPCSPVPGLSYMAPDKKSIAAFKRRLINKGLKAIIRESKGSDILASCGQLAGSV